MKCVSIQNSLFSVNNPAGSGLITALLKLNNCGVKIIVDDKQSINDILIKVIENEGITIEENSGRDCETVVDISVNDKPELSVGINGDYKYSNIYEAVASLCSSYRTAVNQRSTKETNIELALNLDGKGTSDIDTGIGFFDHMLDQIARHGNIDLKIKVIGDLHVDEHHTVEDVGIALGETILTALGDKAGIKRYGYLLPMDDSVAKVAVDIGGRQYLNFKCKFSREFVGEFPTELTEEFFKGVAQGLKANIFIRAKGKNDHHKIEAIFKGFAKSLNEACRFDERAKGQLPSTKGLL